MIKRIMDNFIYLAMLGIWYAGWIYFSHGGTLRSLAADINDGLLSLEDGLRVVLEKRYHLRNGTAILEREL